MKKFFTSLLALVIGASILSGFAACKKNDPPTHARHSYGDWMTTKQASCIQAGTQERVCSVCGNKITETIPATGIHIYGDWKTEKEASCTEAGVKKRICSSCGNVDTQPISATGIHNYGDWTTDKEASCTETGMKKRVCASCGDIETQPIPAMHLRSSNGVCPDCGVEQLTYTLHSDKTYNCFASEAGKNSREIEIPAEHDGIAVGHVGSKAFENCRNLESIFIPASITGMMTSAFKGLSSLTSIRVSEDSEKYCVKDNCLIGKQSKVLIVGCNTSRIPTDGSVTSITSYAFSCREGLTGIVIPEGVTMIDSSAFLNCAGLKSVTFPNSLTEIKGFAFEGCTSLESVVIPESVKTLGGSAFVDCSALSDISFSQNIKLEVLTPYVFASCTSLKNITIPNSVTDIQEGAFSGCRNLTNVTLGGGVTTIWNSAFKGCIGLESITIPENVTDLRGSAFENCIKLTNIKILGDDISIGNKVFLNTGFYNNTNNWENKVLYIGKHLIEAKEDISGEYRIKDGTVTIAAWAFYERDGLTGTSLPNGVNQIGYYAFYNCINLKSATLPDSVTLISNGVFYGCNTLTEIAYGGKRESWDSIRKLSFWDSETGNYTVHCSDGDIQKDI